MAKSHIRELISQTAIYGLGLFINRFFSFLLIPLYTYFFPPADMGMLNIVQSLWLFIIIFYLYGLETSFIKFYTDKKDVEHRKKVYSTALILVGITSLVFSIILFIFSGSIAEYVKFENSAKGKFLVTLLGLLLFGDAISRIPLLLLRAELKSKKYFVISMITLFLNISLNLILIVGYKMGIESILYVFLLTDIVSFVTGIIFTKKFIILNFDLDIVKKLIIFGNKFIFIGVFILFIDISDRFFLKYFFDESLVGIYSTNYKLASAMGLAISAFKFSWTPYFLNIADDPDNKNVISDVFTYYIFTGLFLFLLFSFLIPPLVTYQISNISILNPLYWSGVSIIPIVLMAYFFSGLFSTLHAAPFFADKTSYLFIVTLTGFISNIVLNFFLIPIFGMHGAAWSTVVSYSLMSVFLYILSQRIYKINYDYKKIFSLSLITAFIYVLYIYFSGTSVITNLILSAILLGAFIFIIHSIRILDMRKLKTLLRKQS